MIATTLKRLAFDLSETRAFGALVRRLETRSRNRPLLRVLAYHRIDMRRDNDPYYPGLISTSPADFAEQMELLANTYHICSMSDVVAAAKGEAALQPDSVLLTFDDATTDFARYAWPVLQSHGLPATVFVPTAYPDNASMHFWWDRLYRAVQMSVDNTVIPTPDGGDVTLVSPTQRRKLFRHLKEYLKTIPHTQFQQRLNDIVLAGGVADPQHNNVLGWNDLRQLETEGVTMVPYNHNHPMLNRLPDDEIQNEVTTSCDVLLAQIGDRVSRTLAYPAGGVSDNVVAVLASGGFDLAFSTQRGVNDQAFQNPYRLRRINVGAGTSLGLLRIQLANWGK